MLKKSNTELRNHNSLILKQTKKSVSKQKPKEQQISVSEFHNNASLQNEKIAKARRSVSMQLLGIHAGFKEYLDLIIKELQQKKKELQSCVKMFSLFQGNSNVSLRCLEHNNIQTIYCVSQRRVLCTNCVFGGSKHRTHKLKPLKDSNQYIQEDNKLLNKIIEQDLQNMSQSIKNSQYNTLKLEGQLKQLLQNLQIQYKTKKDHLQQKYALERQSLKRVFQSLIEKSRTSERTIQQLKFKTWQASSKLGISKSSDSINSDANISRQVFLVRISEITQLKVRPITSKEIDKLNKSILKS